MTDDEDTIHFPTQVLAYSGSKGRVITLSQPCGTPSD